jgi:hypothetical protein
VRGRSRNTRRDDPRRHTLGGDQQYLGMAGQGGPLSRTMDLEGQPRGYPPPSNAMLFDDDPGIMSEVETSSTGFRRGGKQRSSLPVVRTPSKTLERPLGLVFLQYRNETKRALLPNEITSIDTVKALFVRSFPKQLTMEYLDSPNVKIYIHDSSKDMFYELEDLRSHLREIRDRSVLRLFESADVSGGLPMAGIGIAGGVGHFEDPSYFSEPEFDSEYQHQHIHKSKGSAGKGAPYYMGSTASLPRGATLLRTYSPAVGALPADRLKSLPTGNLSICCSPTFELSECGMSAQCMVVWCFLKSTQQHCHSSSAYPEVGFSSFDGERRKSNLRNHHKCYVVMVKVTFERCSSQTSTCVLRWVYPLE